MSVTTDHACPDWCIPHEFVGDHWCEPGGSEWPAVVATAYPAEGSPEVIAHPTWGEVDGLDPAVAIWISGGKPFRDTTVDLTPAEAQQLATRLLAAAAAVRDLPTRAHS